MGRRAYRRRVIGWTLAGLVFILGLLCALKLIYPLRYAEEVSHWAAIRSLDPHLVAAVIRAESRFRPRAVSCAGAIGLMQIMPTTGKWIAKQLGEEGFTVEDLYQPERNIRFGTWYLRYLLEQLNDDTKDALIAYNAGLSNLYRWRSGEGSVLPQTEAYIARVQHGWAGYRLLYRLPVLGHLLLALPL